MGKVNTSPAQTPNDEKLSNADIVSYGFGGVTASTYDKFKQFYHMNFLSDVVGVPIGIVGKWSTIMTIWDAINDLIIGSLADRTRSRLGKYRPWLYIGSILLAIVGVMMFTIPGYPRSHCVLHCHSLCVLHRPDVIYHSLDLVKLGIDTKRQSTQSAVIFQTARRLCCGLRRKSVPHEAVGKVWRRCGCMAKSRNSDFHCYSCVRLPVCEWCQKS